MGLKSSLILMAVLSNFLATSFAFSLAINGALAANPGFQLSWQGDSSQDLQTYQAFLSTAQALLPPKMTQVLAQVLPDPLEVSFGNAQDFAPIPLGNCGPEELKGYSAENLSRNQEDGGWFGSKLRHKLILNPAFQSALLQGYSSPQGSCRHGTLYNLAVAAVIHALADRYDRAIGTDTVLSAKRQDACGTDDSDPSDDTDPVLEENTDCQRLRSVHRLVSDREPFLHLMNFIELPFGTENKQRQEDLALMAPDDVRLVIDPQQAFMAAVEDNLMDPGFACVHPGVAAFLNRTLGQPPLSTTQVCQPLMATLFDQPAKQIALDPARVYRVEYLYVHPGDNGLIEKFGHAALRIITSPDSKSEIDSSYVLTFYGQDSGNMIDGLTGALTSRLYVYSFKSYLASYVQGEHRAIERLPLQMSPESLQVLLGTAWEWDLRYRGRWYDLTNNCVTQLDDLLGAALPQLEFVPQPIITPATFADFLKSQSFFAGPLQTIRPENLK